MHSKCLEQRLAALLATPSALCHVDFGASPPSKGRAKRRRARVKPLDDLGTAGSNFRVLPLENPCLLCAYTAPGAALLVSDGCPGFVKHCCSDALWAVVAIYILRNAVHACRHWVPAGRLSSTLLTRCVGVVSLGGESLDGGAQGPAAPAVPAAVRDVMSVVFGHVVLAVTAWLLQQ